MGIRVRSRLEFFYDEESFPEHFFDDEGKVIASIDEIRKWAAEAMLGDLRDAAINESLYNLEPYTWIESE